MQDLPEIDPNKIDIDIRYQDLNRRIILTVRIQDDETWNRVVPEVQLLEKELRKAMKDAKQNP
jgi:hypothetical protein